LYKSDSHKERMVYESRLIHKKQPALNLDQGMLNKTWFDIINKMQ